MSILTIHHTDCGTKLRRKRCTCVGDWPHFSARVACGARGQRVTKTFATKQMAERWAKRQQATMRHAERYGSELTIGDALHQLDEALLNETIENRSGIKYSPDTASSYRGSIRILHKSLNGGLARMPVSELDAPTIVRLREEMKREAISGSTIRNRLMPLRVIVNQAREQGILTTSPFDGVKLPVANGSRDRFADRHEAEALLGLLENPARAFMAVAFYSGLRAGEIAGLKIEHLDIAGATIYVRQAWSARVRKMGKPKSRRSIREVPIPAVLVAHLTEHLATRPSDGEALVFVSTRGGAFNSQSVNDRVRKECASPNVGLQPITLHSARHTYASLSAAAGVPITDLSEFLGHSSLELSLKTYRHLYPEARTFAKAKLDAYLSAA